MHYVSPVKDRVYFCLSPSDFCDKVIKCVIKWIDEWRELLFGSLLN